MSRIQFALYLIVNITIGNCWKRGAIKQSTMAKMPHETNETTLIFIGILY